jgi:hypothetical protein
LQLTKNRRQVGAVLQMHAHAINASQSRSQAAKLLTDRMQFNLEAKMKGLLSGTGYALLIAMFLCGTISAQAQGQSTEIQGYYQTYRNFSFKTGVSELDIPETRLNGGGFTIAQNLAPWFAMWTQLTFYGSAEQPNNKVRIINNLQGLRWQTKLYGPFQFYAKGGMGFTHYSMDIMGSGFGEYKFSVSYGGGAFVWATEHFGIVLDATNTTSGMPNLTDLSNRDKWDSGLTLSSGLAIRF